MGLHVPPEATEKALRIPRAGSAELLNLSGLCPCGYLITRTRTTSSSEAMDSAAEAETSPVTSRMV